MTHPWNASALDIARFAETGGQGHWLTPLSELPRVMLSNEFVVDGEEPVCEWHLQGQTRGSAANPQAWLHLQARLTLSQRCQRCLEPLTVPLAIDRWFRFVADEATALAEDDASEEDLLSMSSEFDALNLLEDELLLAMPLIVGHGNCQTPSSAALRDDLPHPFAALAGLKTPRN